MPDKPDKNAFSVDSVHSVYDPDAFDPVKQQQYLKNRAAGMYRDASAPNTRAVRELIKRGVLRDASGGTDPASLHPQAVLGPGNAPDPTDPLGYRGFKGYPAPQRIAPQPARPRPRAANPTPAPPPAPRRFKPRPSTVDTRSNAFGLAPDSFPGAPDPVLPGAGGSPLSSFAQLSARRQPPPPLLSTVGGNDDPYAATNTNFTDAAAWEQFDPATATLYTPPTPHLLPPAKQKKPKPRPVVPAPPFKLTPEQERQKQAYQFLGKKNAPDPSAFAAAVRTVQFDPNASLHYYTPSELQHMDSSGTVSYGHITNVPNASPYDDALADGAQGAFDFVKGITLRPELYIEDHFSKDAESKKRIAWELAPRYPTMSNPTGMPGGVGYDRSVRDARRRSSEGGGAGAAGRTVGRVTLPTVMGGLAAAATTGLLNVEEGPFALIPAAIVGGAVSGLTAAGEDKMDQTFLSPETYSLVRAQDQRDAQQYPNEVFFGENLPQLALATPTASFGRTAMLNRLAAGGVGAGMDAIQQVLPHSIAEARAGTWHPEQFDLAHVGKTFGTQFVMAGKPTVLGEAIHNTGTGVGRAARGALDPLTRVSSDAAPGSRVAPIPVRRAVARYVNDTARGIARLNVSDARGSAAMPPAAMSSAPDTPPAPSWFDQHVARRVALDGRPVQGRGRAPDLDTERGTVNPPKPTGPKTGKTFRAPIVRWTPEGQVVRLLDGGVANEHGMVRVLPSGVKTATLLVPKATTDTWRKQHPLFDSPTAPAAPANAGNTWSTAAPAKKTPAPVAITGEKSPVAAAAATPRGVTASTGALQAQTLPEARGGVALLDARPQDGDGMLRHGSEAPAPDAPLSHETWRTPRDAPWSPEGQPFGPHETDTTAPNRPSKPSNPNNPDNPARRLKPWRRSAPAESAPPSPLTKLPPHRWRPADAEPAPPAAEPAAPVTEPSPAPPGQGAVVSPATPATMNPTTFPLSDLPDRPGVGYLGGAATAVQRAATAARAVSFGASKPDAGTATMTADSNREPLSAVSKGAPSSASSSPTPGQPQPQRSGRPAFPMAPAPATAATRGNRFSGTPGVAPDTPRTFRPAPPGSPGAARAAAAATTDGNHLPLPRETAPTTLTAPTSTLPRPETTYPVSSAQNVERSEGENEPFPGHTTYHTDDNGYLTTYEDEHGNRYFVSGTFPGGRGTDTDSLASQARRHVTVADGRSSLRSLRPGPADPQTPSRLMSASYGESSGQDHLQHFVEQIRRNEIDPLDAAEDLLDLSGDPDANDEERREAARKTLGRLKGQGRSLPPDSQSLLQNIAGLIELDDEGRRYVGNGEIDAEEAARIGARYPGNHQAQHKELAQTVNRGRRGNSGSYDTDPGERPRPSPKKLKQPQPKRPPATGTAPEDFSGNLYRGDKYYEDGRGFGRILGSPEAYAATIKPGELDRHVLDKEEDDTSAYTSFSERVSVNAEGENGAAFFTDTNNNEGQVFKVKKEDLQSLVDEGAIRVYTPELVYLKLIEDGINEGRANAVLDSMTKNHEIIVEGHIPDFYTDKKTGLSRRIITRLQKK